MAGPVIRSAIDADGPVVCRLVEAVLAEFALTPDYGGMDADLLRPGSFYGERAGVFDLVLDAGGAVAGTAALLPLDVDTVELRKMYFSPAIRGRGWGRLMVERMMAIARSRGYVRMELKTASVLTGAIALYESCGFVPAAETISVSRCDRAFERAL